MTRLNSLTKKIQLTLSLHVISNINARKNHLNNPFIKCKTTINHLFTTKILKAQQYLVIVLCVLEKSQQYNFKLLYCDSWIPHTFVWSGEAIIIYNYEQVIGLFASFVASNTTNRCTAIRNLYHFSSQYNQSLYCASSDAA